MRPCAIAFVLVGACTAPAPVSSPSPAPQAAKEAAPDAPPEPVDVTEDPPSEPPDEPEADPPSEPPPTGPKTLLAIEAEWDAEPGPDRIALFDDGRLTAGKEEGKANLPTSGGYFFDEQARLDIARLGHPKHERVLVVAIPTGDEEDPANVYQLFVSEGGALKKIWEATVGTYGVVPLEFPGDGSVEYLEDDWTACERAKFPVQVARKQVVLRIGKGGMLREVKRRPTAKIQKCGELAACPFVYVAHDGAWALQGEILRNLRGAAAYGLQTLPLPVPRDGVLRVRIAEEKDEVTRLDAIEIVADGEVLPLRACTAEVQPAWCRIDRAPTVLRRGDVLELEVQVPDGAEQIELRAAGYYAVPR